MDVTNDNFQQLLPSIIDDIHDSDFIAIDGEFTGLNASSFGYGTPFDTPEERYLKIKQSCKKFLLIQFGIATFKAQVENSRYVAKAYNIYVFPTPSSKRARDKRFLCQAGSMDFLSKHCFNFNKLFREGIGYLTPEEENKLRAKLAHTDEAGSDCLSSQNQRKLDTKIGFSKVIRAITNSRKLVVGHSMILNLFHILTNFHGVLPKDLEEFKDVTKIVLPRLVDTKLMASTSELKEMIRDSGLSALFQTLQHAPFVPVQVEIPESFQRYSGEQALFHEAGYDALITGLSFATMVNHLGKLQDPLKDFTLPSSSLVEPYINKLFLRDNKEIPYFNIDGPDLKVDREGILHVTFPKEWQRSDLKALFQPYGKVQVSKLTKTTAYIALQNNEKSTLALRELSQLDESFCVTSYAAYQLNKTTRLLSPSSSTALSTSWPTSESASSSAALSDSLTASSSAALRSPSIPSKRKFEDKEADNLPTKTKRHSTDELMLVEGETLIDSVQDEEGNSHDVEAEKTEDKLFEESETW